MKKVIAKKWRHFSKLGEADFFGVPIVVDDDFPAKSGAVVSVKDTDPRVAIGADMIDVMEREVAKKWVIDFIEGGRKPSSITPDEIYGILLIFGVNKTEFARLLEVSKSSVTKYVDGSLTPVDPVVRLMLIYLAAELTKPGTAANLLRESGALIHGLSLTVPAPKFTIKKTPKAA